MVRQSINRPVTGQDLYRMVDYAYMEDFDEVPEQPTYGAFSTPFDSLKSLKIQAKNVFLESGKAKMDPFRQVASGLSRLLAVDTNNFYMGFYTSVNSDGIDGVITSNGGEGMYHWSVDDNILRKTTPDTYYEIAHFHRVGNYTYIIKKLMTATKNEIYYFDHTLENPVLTLDSRYTPIDGQATMPFGDWVLFGDASDYTLTAFNLVSGKIVTLVVAGNNGSVLFTVAGNAYISTVDELDATTKRITRFDLTHEMFVPADYFISANSIGAKGCDLNGTYYDEYCSYVPGSGVINTVGISFALSGLQLWPMGNAIYYYGSGPEAIYKMVPGVSPDVVLVDDTASKMLDIAVLDGRLFVFMADGAGTAGLDGIWEYISTTNGSFASLKKSAPTVYDADFWDTEQALRVVFTPNGTMKNFNLWLMVGKFLNGNTTTANVYKHFGLKVVGDTNTNKVYATMGDGTTETVLQFNTVLVTGTQYALDAQMVPGVGVVVNLNEEQVVLPLSGMPSGDVADDERWLLNAQLFAKGDATVDVEQIRYYQKR